MIQFHLCIFHVAHITLQHTHTDSFSQHIALYIFIFRCARKNSCITILLACSVFCLCLSLSTFVPNKNRTFVCFFSFLFDWSIISVGFFFFFRVFFCSSLLSFTAHFHDCMYLCVCDRFRWTIMTVVSQYVVFSLEFIYLVCYTQLHKYASICVQNHSKRKKQLSACLPLLLTFSFVRSFFSVHLKVTHRHKRAI